MPSSKSDSPAPLDIEALRAVARAATPGHWHPDKHGGYVWGPKGEMIADQSMDLEAPRRASDTAHLGMTESIPLVRMRGVGGNLPIDANRKHICAFSPAVALQLLDEVAALRRIRDAKPGVAEAAWGAMPSPYDIDTESADAMRGLLATIVAAAEASDE
jgi:hypothetical protein